MTSRAEAGQAAGHVSLRSWVAVLGGVVGCFMAGMNVHVTNASLPDVRGSLGASFEEGSWITTAYLVAEIIIIPMSGWLVSVFSMRRVLMVGTGGFILFSIVCSMAPDINTMIVARALQGAFGGVLIPLSFQIIVSELPSSKHPFGMALFAVANNVAQAAGPSLGGWLTEAYSWRWIFYLNLPLGIIALTALLVLLPATISERSHSATEQSPLRRIDITGALLCTVATICLLLGLTWGSNQMYAWISPQVAGILAAAAILLLLFLLVERRAFEPILPLHFFRNQIFMADAMLALLVYMILIGLAIYLPLFLQGVLGISATNAGVGITPFLVSVTLGATLAGWLITIRKRYQAIVVVGTCVMTIGAFFLTRMTPAIDLRIAMIFMVMTGSGIGAIFSVLYLAIQNVLPLTQLGVGSAVVRYLGQIGSTLGVAIVGTVVNQSLAGSDTLAVALQHGFLAIFMFCAIALLTACFLKDTPMKQQSDEKSGGLS